jgi:hypothetical protein
MNSPRRARATIATVEAEAAGTLADDAFVDPAMVGAARLVVALADRYGTAGTGRLSTR